MGTFRMPSLGADMETGRLVEWLVAPGTAVRRGDVVAVVETQKGAIEIEVFEDGVLTETLVEPDTEVPVGTPIAEIRGAGDDRAPAPGPAAAADREPVATAPPREPVEAAPAPLPAAADVPPAEPPLRPSGPPLGQPPEPPPESPRPPEPPEPPPAARPEAVGPEAVGPEAVRPRASPAARRRAAETGVALASLTGTGPEGAIVFADVEQAARGGPSPAAEPAPPAEARAEPPPPSSEAVRQEPRAPAPEPAAAPAPRRGLDMGEMRKAIAAAMARSKREIPHFYLEQRVALTAARTRLDALNDERPPAERLLPAVLFIKATALALARHPAFNGHYVDGAFRPAERVHLGTAVAVRGGGLIAPAIHDADRLDLDRLMARLKDLVARVRSGGLRGSELADPTATLTSLGDRGVETVWGVIHPPQVAMIGAGRPFRRPWAEGDALAVREVVSLTLAADHRVADGHAGALFLDEIGRLLETPEEL